jgi:hypothetical protein
MAIGHSPDRSTLDRCLNISRKLIDSLKLDLTGLTLLTECASGAYSFTPILGLLAGARVIAMGRDSRFGLYSENKSRIESIIRYADIAGDIQFFEKVVPHDWIEKVDIVTNSGFVRPIKEDLIAQLKSTAVIALMWETWEFRTGEIDIRACQRHGIPVIGTDEKYYQINLYSYPGLIALKILFELSLEIVRTQIVLIGDCLTARLIAKTFKDLELDFEWFGGVNRSDGIRPLSELQEYFDRGGVEAVICADHNSGVNLGGESGYISFQRIATANPFLKWGHISGEIDSQALYKSGLHYFPNEIMPPGYMSYQGWDLGPRPVLELNAAGLKVGEIAAKSRLAGESVEKAIQRTVDYGIGQDFSTGFFNFAP